MWMLLTALWGIYAALLTVTIQADVHHFETTGARIQLRVAGVHKTWRLTLLRTAQGHRLVLAGEQGVRPLDAGQLRQSRGSMLLDALLRADKARRFLLRHTRLDQLDGLLLLRTPDAARSALWAGTLQGLLGCIPPARRRHVRLRVLPEFFRAHTTLSARCIIRFRLGTILITASLLLLAWFREQQLQAREAT